MRCVPGALSVGGRVGDMTEKVALLEDIGRRTVVAVPSLAGHLAPPAEARRPLEDELGREEAVVVEVEEELALH